MAPEQAAGDPATDHRADLYARGVVAYEAHYQLVGHRDLIGRPAFEAMPEAAAGGFPERVAGVMATGVPFVGRELPVPLARTPGAPPEERWVDLVYLPLVEPEARSR
jgi:hypothetical protein